MGFSAGKNIQNNINLDEAQTLSNKTLDSTNTIEAGATIQTPAIINPSRSDVKKDTLANLQTYASSASNGQLCYATDSKKMFQVLDGALAEVGGGAGGINYISNPDAEVNADGWSNYANTTPGVLPDDFGGTVDGGWSNIAASPSSPLRGSKSFIFGGINGGANDLQGHGVYSSFTVDSADLAKKLTISFDYLIDDSLLSNAVDGMLRVYIYDEDKSQLIRVNGEDLKLNANSGTHYAQFQTDSVSTNYRLVIHQALALVSSEDYAIRIDNVQVGPTKIALGMPTASQYSVANSDFTATVTGGTVNEMTAIPYQTGDGTWRMKFNLRMTGWGTTTANTITISGITTGSFRQACSIAYSNSNGSYMNASMIASSNTITCYSEVSVNWATFETYVSGDIELAEKPTWARDIQQAQMSEDLGGREIIGRYTTTTTPTIGTSLTDIDFDTVNDETVSMMDVATGIVTIPESGYYDLFVNLEMSGTQTEGNVIQVDFTKSVSTVATIARSRVTLTTATEMSIQNTALGIYLVKGETVKVQASNASASTVSLRNTAANRFDVIKRSSPQTILETETVAARYTSNSGQSMSPGTDVIYEDRDFDTHNTYNTSTGVYTVPVSGIYQVNASFRLNSANATNAAILVNGIIKTFGTYSSGSQGNPSMSDIITLEKGDLITVEQNGGPSGTTLSTTSGVNYFSIARIK